MKYFIFLMIFSSLVQAKAYKCDVKGKTTYQQSPCANGGSEFKFNKDTSLGSSIPYTYEGSSNNREYKKTRSSQSSSQKVQTGPRGGRYVITKNGKKRYLKK